jgi:hypothetical protein
MDHHTGVVIAEVGFLPMLFAVIGLASSEIPQLKAATARRIVAGAALALGGLLLIIATHWGHFPAAREAPGLR